MLVEQIPDNLVGVQAEVCSLPVVDSFVDGQVNLDESGKFFLVVVLANCPRFPVAFHFKLQQRNAGSSNTFHIADPLAHLELKAQVPHNGLGKTSVVNVDVLDD